MPDYAVNCGSQLDGDEKFCAACGQPVTAQMPPQQATQPRMYQQQWQYPHALYQQGMVQQPYLWSRPQEKGTLASFIDNVNRMTGGTEHVELKMKDLVESVFRQHTKQEAEEIFIYGTAATNRRCLSSKSIETTKATAAAVAFSIVGKQGIR